MLTKQSTLTELAKSFITTEKYQGVYQYIAQGLLLKLWYSYYWRSFNHGKFENWISQDLQRESAALNSNLNCHLYT